MSVAGVPSGILAGAASPDIGDASAAVSADVMDEVVRYCTRPTSSVAVLDRPLPSLPLPDEPCAAVWTAYAEEAMRVGTPPALRQHLVQLQFPIRAGISDDVAYRSTTRRGRPAPPDVKPLAFDAPDALRIFMHPTAAGRVPVVVAGTRADFTRLGAGVDVSKRTNAGTSVDGGLHRQRLQ